MKLSLGQRLAVGAIKFGTPIAEAAGRLAGAVEGMSGRIGIRARGVPDVKAKNGVPVGDPYLRDIYPEEPVSADSTAGMVTTRRHLERSAGGEVDDHFKFREEPDRA